MKPKLLASVKLGLTHRPLPSRVSLLKVVGFRCLYVLVTEARCLFVLGFFERGHLRMTQQTP